MKLFGIELRRPSFNEVTAAAVMGSGLWLLALGLLRAGGAEIGRTDAGALLVVVLWGALSARVGIRIGLGHRHLAANVAVSALLLGVYQGSLALALTA